MTTPAQSWIATLEPLRQRFTTRRFIGLPCSACAPRICREDSIKPATSTAPSMNHFGLAPAAPFPVAVIVLELGASAMILTGFYRWLGALGLAGFTLMATFVANRFWEMAGPERFMSANSFFEHLGLVGGFLLIAWYDLREKKGIASL